MKNWREDAQPDRHRRVDPPDGAAFAGRTPRTAEVTWQTGASRQLVDSGEHRAFRTTEVAYASTGDGDDSGSGAGDGDGDGPGVAPHRPGSGRRPDTRGPERVHDPHEVTIQLDRAHLPPCPDAPGDLGGTVSRQLSDTPVFVDESGRRSRRLRRVGIGFGAACALYAGVIGATLLSGNSTAPWLPVPGQQGDGSAGEVATSPEPSRSASPSASATVGQNAITPSVGTAADASPTGTGTPTASGAQPSGATSSSGASPSASATEPGVTVSAPGTAPTGNSSASPAPSATDGTDASTIPSPSSSAETDTSPT
ncbi:hypothetical protein OG226_01515 [Streptomyces sp. NBC_01261]|uniref:hypothetical protein n=1 Tax=Streptomyces sp. NBC_01261 TaxID=2903802 RepID=UPI002E2F0D3A|nr:hypothetical protein [Streptomyces sp. NBC_01261]